MSGLGRPPAGFFGVSRLVFGTGTSSTSICGCVTGAGAAFSTGDDLGAGATLEGEAASVAVITVAAGPGCGIDAIGPASGATIGFAAGAAAVCAAPSAETLASSISSQVRYFRICGA